MNKENFNQLLDSMREGAAILRGERAPSRQFRVECGKDAKIVRESCNATQTAFAKFMGVSVGTLRNWEQGRRHASARYVSGNNAGCLSRTCREMILRGNCLLAVDVNKVCVTV